MSLRRIAFSAAAAVLLVVLAEPTLAQEEEPVPEVEAPPPAYDERLLRLAEILGALHFLRPLCGHDDGGAWKADMEALLAGESPGPLRRARLVARFNHGFETFHAVYRACTPSAQRASALYVEEGSRIAADVTARYGQ
ncbi:MAG TPA: TIGR02301 family protein [Afifellaceae bacterium]|nr:TIGR02301 family protein [Afifellaceae bacterium]